MVTVTMTHTECLLKLLALGGMTRQEIVECTCWSEQDVDAALGELCESRQVATHHLQCNRGALLYFVDHGCHTGRRARGATGRAVANARRSTFLPAHPHD